LKQTTTLNLPGTLSLIGGVNSEGWNSPRSKVMWPEL